jgi:hypothetical protein
MMMKAMSTDLTTVELESFCGFCGCRVGADLETRRKHMFECKKHPAHELVEALQAIASLAENSYDDDDLSWLVASIGARAREALPK